MPLHPKLLEILRCPACRSPLRVAEPEKSLACTGCPRTYPIVDGIPVVMVDRAGKTSDTA
jgi:uncharacterized protein YbaR (Trm112 family)